MAPTLRALALAAAALGLAASLSLDLAERDLTRPYDIAYLPSGAVARVASLGQRLLVSDLYWLSAVQYIGEREALTATRGWDRLYPALDLVTDLDPRHGYAYQTGGIVLSQVHRLEESDAILEKGVAKGPPYWTFPYYLAFNAWFYRADYESAARWAERAARTPGASPNVSHLALSLASKSGTPEQALQLLDDLLATEEEEAIRSRLEEQRRLALLEQAAQQVERAMREEQVRIGRPVTHLSELLSSGALRALPADPFGGQLVLDPKDGRVHSTANPFRFSLKAGPQFESSIPVEVHPQTSPAGRGREEQRP